jgi:hypothetical protein
VPPSCNLAAALLQLNRLDHLRADLLGNAAVLHALKQVLLQVSPFGSFIQFAGGWKWNVVLAGSLLGTVTGEMGTPSEVGNKRLGATFLLTALCAEEYASAGKGTPVMDARLWSQEVWFALEAEEISGVRNASHGGKSMWETCMWELEPGAGASLCLEEWRPLSWDTGAAPRAKLEQRHRNSTHRSGA